MDLFDFLLNRGIDESVVLKLKEEKVSFLFLSI